MYSVYDIMESSNIAVFGASRDPFKPGSMLLSMLKETGFEGRYVGINPKGGEVHGVPLYANIGDVPFPVEIAVLLIQPKLVPSIITECAQCGVKGVVISAEGFAETGPEGRQLQEEIHSILKETGIRAFGPNTLGVVNTATGLTTSYATNKRMLRPGGVGFAAQSGIFVGGLLQYMSSIEGLQLSKGMSLGNKVDVDESDALEYLMDDEKTRVVGLYLEDIRDGRRFVEIAKRAVKKKPVLLLKGGRTDAGAHAVTSHTASLAVNNSVLDGALRQSGIQRMSNLEELLSSLIGFQWMPLPKGNRIAIVTYSGAQGIMSIDAAMDSGLEVASFLKDTQERLTQILAPHKAHNPIDIFPDMMAHGMEKTLTGILEPLLDDDGVHGIIFILITMGEDDNFDPVVEMIKKRSNKPVFFSLMGVKEGMDKTKQFLEERQIPVYLFPEIAIRVISHMWEYSKMLKRN